MAGPIHMSLIFGFAVLIAVAERPTKEQEHLSSEDLSAVVGAKGMKGIKVPRASEEKAPSSLLDASSQSQELSEIKGQLASMQKRIDQLEEKVMGNKSDRRGITCGKDVTAPDHDTLGTCSRRHCGKSGLFSFGTTPGPDGRGNGCVCDPAGRDANGKKTGGSCICAPGYCAAPFPVPDTKQGKCVPCDSLEADEESDTVNLEDALMYGGTAAEREKAKRLGLSKQVGECAYFHCSADRAPEQPNGGGVGCNPVDSKCYCLAEGYFASNSAGGNWKDGGENKCVKPANWDESTVTATAN